jgi:hypothetical protein
MARTLAAFLLVAACAHASRTSSPAFWSDVETEHFLLRTDLDAGQAEREARDLELIRAAVLHSGWFDGVRLPAGRTTVVHLDGKELREFAISEV